MAGYVLEGPRWGNGAAGSGATVSWAVDSSISTSFLTEIKAAFATWASYANLTFQQVSSTATANIDFSNSYIDGLNKVLGQATYYYSGQRFISAQVTFDSCEGWRAVGSDVRSSTGVDLYVVALHEIGHAVGLDHYNDTPSLMNAYLSSSVTGLAASDINGIRALYGAATIAPTAPVILSSLSANAAQFGSFAYDATSAGGKVYAVYDALLGRAADPLGLAAWTKAVDQGLTLKDLAQGFLTSLEGQARAGALGNSAFIDQLYNATLHRHSDLDGLTAWTSRLDQGMSRADVALGFAFSPEHLNNLRSVFNAGVYVPDATVSAVARLYHTVLDRAPDASGLLSWTNQVRHGTSLQAVTESFLKAPETQTKTGGLTKAEYVDWVYENALGRHAEAAGLVYWTDKLDHGGSRAEVTTAISQSQEAQVHLLGRIETGWNLI